MQFVGVSCLWWVLFVQWTLAQDADSYCPKADMQAKDLKFTKQPSTLQYACVGEYFELHCCLQGYSKITWYQLDHGEWVEFKKLHPTSQRRLNHHNQTVELLYPVSKRDGGKWQCHAESNNGQHLPVLSNTVDLVLQSCVNWDFPPLVMTPLENKTVRIMPSESLVVNCQAFYGTITNTCTDGMCWLNWGTISTEGKPEVVQISNDSTKRIWATNYAINKESLGTQFNSTLHIRDIQEKDYSYTYWCWMNNGHANGQARYFRLVKGKMPVWKYALVTFAAIVGLVLAAVPIILRFKLDIKLLFKEHFWRQRGFNVALMGSREDGEFTQNLFRQLQKNKNLKIFQCIGDSQQQCTTGEGQPGENDQLCTESPTDKEMIKTHKSIENGFKIAFLLSSNFLGDFVCLTSFKKVIADDYTNVVLIMLEQIPQGHKDAELVYQATQNGIPQMQWPQDQPLADVSWGKAQVSNFLKNLESAIMVRQYDVVFVYDTDSFKDQNFARSLYDCLQQEFHYQVFISDAQPTANEMLINALEKAKSNSHVIVFVLSESFFGNGDCRKILDHTCADEERNMGFILLDPIEKIKEGRDVEASTEKSITHGRKVSWPWNITIADDRIIDERDGEAGVDWNKRETKNFVKKLRLLLPRLPRAEPCGESAPELEPGTNVAPRSRHNRRGGRGGRSSSTKGLLNSCSDPEQGQVGIPQPQSSESGALHHTESTSGESGTCSNNDEASPRMTSPALQELNEQVPDEVFETHQPGHVKVNIPECGSSGDRLEDSGVFSPSPDTNSAPFQ